MTRILLAKLLCITLAINSQHLSYKYAAPCCLRPPYFQLFKIIQTKLPLKFPDVEEKMAKPGALLLLANSSRSIWSSRVITLYLLWSKIHSDLKMKSFYDIEIIDDENGKNLIELNTHWKLSNHLFPIYCCRSFTNQYKRLL